MPCHFPRCVIDSRWCAACTHAVMAVRQEGVSRYGFRTSARRCCWFGSRRQILILQLMSTPPDSRRRLTDGGAKYSKGGGKFLALPPPRHQTLDEFRVLVLDTHPMVPTSGEITLALTDLANRLERKGCTVGRAVEELPDMSDLTETFAALLMSFMGVDTTEASYAEASARSKTKEGNPQDRSMTMSHREWVWLDRHRLELSASWQKTFERWDVVVCPLCPTTAFPYDDRPFEQRTIEVNGAHVGYDTVPLWARWRRPVACRRRRCPSDTIPSACRSARRSSARDSRTTPHSHSPSFWSLRWDSGS